MLDEKVGRKMARRKTTGCKTTGRQDGSPTDESQWTESVDGNRHRNVKGHHAVAHP